jgi:hypothetical protein
MKIKSFKNFISIIAAALSFIIILSAIALPGCIPSGIDAGKKDTASDNTGNKDTSETTGDVNDNNNDDDKNTGVVYNNAPRDFSVHLTWSTGALPPPYHYSYSILCGPGLNGIFTYHNGKSLSQNLEPVVIDFGTSIESMDGLYVFLEENNFFRNKWDKAAPSIGGSSTIIKISAKGKTYEIPPDFELKPGDAKIINKAAYLINSMVPEQTWAEIQKLQSEFEKSYEEQQS